MNVLFFVTGLGVGGAEKIVISLADALAAKGHEVFIVYMTGSAMVFPQNRNIPVVGLDMSSGIDVVRAFLVLKKLIRDFQPDVVHSHMMHANIFARLVRLVIPIKRLISTAHSSNEGGKLRMLAYRLTDALADISTNVSEEAVAAFVKVKAVKPGRMVAVHNGIDEDVFVFTAAASVRIRQELFICNNCKLILAVGRLHEAKDYSNLFHALAHFPVNGPAYKMFIVGDGPLRYKLEALAVHLGIADRVRFLGLRRDVPDLMSAADVFVLSSAWEGFGLVVAEAMACERVVVATDCGGVREVLGNTGYLVRPRNSAALANALQDALNLTGAERAIMGSAARQRVIEFYALNTVVNKWLKLYLGPAFSESEYSS